LNKDADERQAPQQHQKRKVEKQHWLEKEKQAIKRRIYGK